MRALLEVPRPRLTKSSSSIYPRGTSQAMFSANSQIYVLYLTYDQSYCLLAAISHATRLRYRPDTDLRLDGTVYLGKDLVHDEVEAYSWFNIVLWGIVSHECGHILQYSQHQPIPKKGGEQLRRELEADFLAGYYLGIRWRETKFDTRAFRDSISQKGDESGGTEQTHGTREQRVRAVEHGIRFGLNGIKSSLDILDAASVEAKTQVTLE